jgi:pimeloyl-ACP methyl ester carboxylesterase
MILMNRLIKSAAITLGAVYAYQLAWGLSQVASRNVHQTLATHRNLGKPGVLFDQTHETEVFTRRHWLEDGIERIVYTPKIRRFGTPIVMQHGMWHGAWCWETWQEALAEWGWETHAHSLPGHAASPAQTPIEACTLDYYLGFLKAEIDRLPYRPVLIGHSMGGALAQWYLKYVDDLPAAVLVAPWPYDAIRTGTLLYFTMADPIGVLLSCLTHRAEQIRTRASAARALISKSAIYTPEQLHARLTPESAIILLQYLPLFWQAPERIDTVMLLLAGEKDAVVSEHAEKMTADHYGADFAVYEGAAHNLMMEPNHREIARRIHDWLIQQGIP